MRTPKLIAIFLASFAIMAHAQLVYTITGAGTSFTANKDRFTVSSDKAIQSVINDIKADAAGSPCTIFFGSGRPGVGIQPPEIIDIGANNISFDGSGSPTWGLITLEGNITSSYNPPVSMVGPPPILGVIYLSNGTSIESTANIANTAGTVAIENNSTGSVTIKGGTISARGPTINGGTGTLTINSGEILAQNGRAVNKTDKIILNGGLLFGYGYINDKTDIINGTYTTPGNPVILGWNKEAGHATYIAGTSDDIVISPATATAVWSNRNGYARIDYANGATSGFRVIEGVTVVNPSSSSTTSSSSSVQNPSSSSIGGSSSSSDNPVPIRLTNNTIVLENLPTGTKIEVYNLQGKRIYSAYPENPKILRIGVQTKGIYIIKQTSPANTHSQYFRLSLP
ncbi:MAG: T9SS type A sorting domain-containing protein [Fibromonadaceae bacterium]|jgi:hypothetical protein|nr:T9SS type A sorting domain-containing protein [Fibromonadaceae bacterium]